MAAELLLGDELKNELRNPNGMDEVLLWIALFRAWSERCASGALMGDRGWSLDKRERSLIETARCYIVGFDKYHSLMAGGSYNRSDSLIACMTAPTAAPLSLHWNSAGQSDHV
jgi:hypothetical protein